MFSTFLGYFSFFFSLFVLLSLSLLYHLLFSSSFSIYFYSHSFFNIPCSPLTFPFPSLSFFILLLHIIFTFLLPQILPSSNSVRRIYGNKNLLRISFIFFPFFSSFFLLLLSFYDIIKGVPHSSLSFSLTLVT